MSECYDCSDPEQRAAGLAAAAAAARNGELVVLPTDTVYGIGADAFSPEAVSALLAAKGRGRDMPPPVLVGSMRAATALVEELGPFGQDLIDEFWPGGLTLVCRAGRTLQWDLGETRGTVAVRMPLHAVALELLKQTGPMAVSSANRTGLPPATTVDRAQRQLGDSVAVYLDGGPCPGGVPSTIVDLTGSVPRLLRDGAISLDRLREVAALITAPEPSGTGAGAVADGAAANGGRPSGTGPGDGGTTEDAASGTAVDGVSGSAGDAASGTAVDGVSGSAGDAASGTAVDGASETAGDAASGTAVDGASGTTSDAGPGTAPDAAPGGEAG